MITEKAFLELLKIHDTDVEVRKRPAYKLLEECASYFAEKNAVIATDRTLTYKELNEEANAVGRRLQREGAEPETIIAVFADRDSYAYVMRQGILKSGGAFLPIDPDYPEERIRYILKDSSSKLIVTTEAIIKRRKDLFDRLTSEGMKVIDALEAIKTESTANIGVEVSGEAPAYVIYTSGSTGKPKGVIITNKNLVNFVDDNEKNREIRGYTGKGSVSLAIAALTFDFSIMEEFVPLSNGMTVVLATKEQIMDPKKLCELMTGTGTDIMSCTPSYMLNLLDIDEVSPCIKALKSVDFGAEAFPPALFKRLRNINPDIYIMNGYGPTEATISCTMQVIEDEKSINIGLPNANVHVITMDEDGNVLSPGEKGELVILGDGVGRGYIGNIEQNKNFIELFGIRAYKTGDLGLVREDGEIEFYGRKDDQVKLRGLRVELGEIESVISSYEGIDNAVVVVKDKPFEHLAAYFTGNPETDKQSLKKHIRKYLTSYMVPQSFTWIDSIPLNANGKVNKDVLPEAEPDEQVIDPAETPTQEGLLTLVREILKTEKIGVTTNLFEMGLSSLGAIRLCNDIQKQFNAVVKTSDLTDGINVKLLEKLIEQSSAGADLSMRESYPLSMTQMGIFIESEKHPGTTVYNIPVLLEIQGSVDKHRLCEAIRKAVAAHPYLFMKPEERDGEVCAVRRDDHSFEAKLINCKRLPDEADLVRPFALLSDDILFRAEIYDTDEGLYLFLDTHHIISDGGSLDILTRDISRAYLEGTVEKEEYTGFEASLDEQYLRGTAKFEKAKEWYDRIFDGCGGETIPPKDGKGDGHIAFYRRLGDTNADDIKEFCQRNTLSVNAFLTSAFGFALKEYTNAEHAVFSTIYNGRNDPRLKNTVSMLVKTLPVYFNPGADSFIVSVLENCQSYLLSAMANDIYSFAEIRNVYDIRADILFAYQSDAETNIDFCGVMAKSRELKLSQAMAALSLDTMIEDGRLSFDVSYDPAQYSEYTVSGLVRLFDHIAGEFLKRERLAEVSLVSKEDEQYIKNLHDTAFEVPERPAYRLLQDSAHKHPDKTALVATDRVLTYRELNEEANAVGRRLKKEGVMPNSTVAVFAHRDSYAYVMRQGVLKSGAAFLPIDPDYPEERIRYILDDSKTKLILTTNDILEKRKSLFDRLSEGDIMTLCAQEAIKEENTEDLNIEVPYEALAYVIYTSGSTGKPKGVMLTNKNLVNFVDDNDKNREILGYTKRGKVSLSIAALTFDFSIMEEFIPLANAMTAVLASEDEIMNPQRLGELMKKTGVDVMSCTPSYISNLLDIDGFSACIRQVKSIDFGAEEFPPSLYKKLKNINPDIHIMNGYGPTETTISCTMKVIESENDITIGIPNANVHVATVDKDGHLQPQGAMGELVIMGDGVGIGYVGRKDLTRKSFIKLLGMKAYRSGDLVRILENGEIEYHGRIDDQVKLRGLRIELGEIENVINTYPGVRSSIVVVVRGQTDYLAAYFTADEKVDIKELKSHLGAYLTGYMVPQAIMQLEMMPLTPNGKIDKKALPLIENSEEEILLPKTPLQSDILLIAKEIIGNELIGITTDLFAYGLTSISCIRLCSRLSERFGADISIREIFENKDIESLEKLILRKREADSSSFVLHEEYPLTRTQLGIYIDSAKYEGTTVYNIPYLYRLDSRVDMLRLSDAVSKAVMAHPYMYMTIRSDKNGEVMAVRNKPEYISFPVLKQEPGMQKAVRPFDLSSGEKLFRIELNDAKSGKYLFIDMHHIISDGESYDIFLRDINRAYIGEDIEPESYTCFESAMDEKEKLALDVHENAKTWYDSIFKGCGGETTPVRDGNPEGERICSKKICGKIGADIVRRFCREHDLTENAFFVTAYGIALKAYTNSEQGVFSTIYNGRNDSRVSDCIGMFVKTIPVMVNVSNEDTVVRAIKNCQSYLLGAMANDIFSFAEIRSAYDIRADLLLVYQGEDEPDKICGFETESMELNLSQAKAALSIEIRLHGDEIIYEAEYDPREYSQYTVEGLVGLLDHIAGEFTKREIVQELTLVSDEDEQRIRNLHDTDYKVPQKPAYRFLQDGADRYPDRNAVIAFDRTLTYRELNEEANAVAHRLIKEGIVPDDIVAVLANRDSYAYVMRQGVLKSGGAFLPIDPEYPEERIRFILEDSGAKIILTSQQVIEEKKDLFDKLSSEGIKIICAQDAVLREKRENPDIQVSGENLAYVIYTSGSTGKPKGVMLYNHNLVNFAAENPRNQFPISYTKRGSVSLAIAALTFDMSIHEEILPLADGITIVLATREDILNPEKLSRLMVLTGVDLMVCTPSFVSNLLDIDVSQKALRNLKSIVVGGEAFTPSLFDRLKEINPEICVINGYGPTETTICCTMQVIKDKDHINIGTPNGNVHVATVDKDGHLQPLGAMGELVILGDGVGGGYIGREDLTKRNFINLLGMKAYRSGDLARILENGETEYHGRIDNQVKLRGLRVELGEIENVINRYPLIQTSIVILVKGSTDYLAAYFTADEKIDIEKLKKHLASYLTEYMVPQAILQLDEMPLTANGKIDKKALPVIAETGRDKQVRKPETELQEILSDIFKRVLNLNDVGTDESFFALGGTSLTAAKVMMAAKMRDIPLAYQDLFDAPTILQLEKKIMEKQSGKEQAIEGSEERRAEESGGAGELCGEKKVLSHNVPEYVREIQAGDIGDVLLTGSSGFLGSHILKDLLDNTDAKIYCLMRESGSDCSKRLQNLMYYYFDTDVFETYPGRITILKGDITDKDSLKAAFCECFSTVINCAASVKHFANIESLMSVNLYGVENLSELCIEKGVRLIHVSTVSVGGDMLKSSIQGAVLMENILDMGQDVESNMYVYSKYLAEKHIIDRIENDGLKAKIMRVGNLMGRDKDGEFQMNFKTNNFVNTLRAYSVLGCFPYSGLDERVEFSPIDETASAIVKLSGTGDDFNIFHVYNSNSVEMGEVISIMRQCGMNIDFVEDETFKEKVKNTLLDDRLNSYVSPLINYDTENSEEYEEVPADNKFTVKALYRLSFHWSVTESEYLFRLIDGLKTLGFFDIITV